MSDTQVDRAREFATNKHAAAGQMYNGQPYSVHLAAVEGVLLRFGHTSPEMRAAAWLHDTVEDCDVTLDEVAALFGSRVAELVGAVTNGAGANRRERAAVTYPKIRATPGAVIVKLSDRIANVEASAATVDRPNSGGDFRALYQGEHPGFRAALYSPDPASDAMWVHLDALLA